MSKSEKLLAEAKAMIDQHGDEPAFQLISLEMEAAAADGDMKLMKQKADLLFAVTTLITSRSDHTVH